MGIPLMLGSILGGVGKGLEGAGDAAVDARKEAQKRAENLVPVTPDLVESLKAGGVDLTPFMGKTLPKQVFDVTFQAASKRGEIAREETANRTYADQLRRENPPVTTMRPDTGTERAYEQGVPTEPVSAPPATTSLPPLLRSALGLLESGSAGKEGRAEAFKAVQKNQEQQREDEMLRRYGGGAAGGNGSVVPPGMSLKAGPVTFSTPAQMPTHVTKQIGNREVAFLLGPDGNVINQVDLGDASSARGVYNRQDVENQVNLEHTTQGSQFFGKLPPGSLAWQQRYNDLARQFVVPQGGFTGGPGTGLGGGAPAQTQPPSNVLPSGKPLAERPFAPSEQTQYVHKTTLQPPSANMQPTQVQGSGEYVPVQTGTVQKFGAIRTVNQMLKSMEDIIAKRPDLFPPLTGDSTKDAMNVTLARGKWAGMTSWMSPYKGTDPDIAAFQSNMAALPTTVRSFGDVGNIAQKEQAIASEAEGLNGPSGRQSAEARINNVRQLLNAGLEGLGLQPFLKPAGPGAVKLGGPAGVGNAAPTQGRISVIAPDGTPGTLPAGAAIPPGYRTR